MKIEKAAILALGLVIALPAAVHAKDGQPAPGKAEGALTAVNAAATPPTVTITGRTAVTVNITSTTKIEINEKHVTLADLVIGDRAEAKFDPATMNASQVEEVVPATAAATHASSKVEATGTVLSADPVAGQVALDLNGDGVVDVTLVVNAQSDVRIGNVTLAELELALLDGLTVKVQFDSVTFAAKQIRASDQSATTVTGTFVSFDPATETLAITTAAGPETLVVPAAANLKGSGKLTRATVPVGSTLVIQQLVNGAGTNIALSINVKSANRGGGANSGGSGPGSDDPAGDDHGNGGNGADDGPGHH